MFTSEIRLRDLCHTHIAHNRSDIITRRQDNSAASFYTGNI